MRSEYDAGASRRFSFQWEEDEAITCCPYAREFEVWTEELAARLLENGTLVSINQAKVLLLDQYQRWRDSVPKVHQSYTGERHICLFHVFDAFYKRLRLAELSLQPPLLFLPDVPRKRDFARLRQEPPMIYGISIGERTDQE